MTKLISSFDNIRNKGIIVFTNGCFDILHMGHVSYLMNAKKLGDILIVGVNSDSSVKRNKGESRPINNQDDRANMLAALECVDYVAIFEEDTPFNIISSIKPNVRVKGLDYIDKPICGQEVVEAYGGKVTVVGPFMKNTSTSDIISRIIELNKKEV